MSNVVDFKKNDFTMKEENLKGKTVEYISGYGKNKGKEIGEFIRYVGDDKFEVDRGFTKTYIWKKDRLLGLHHNPYNPDPVTMYAFVHGEFVDTLSPEERIEFDEKERLEQEQEDLKQEMWDKAHDVVFDYFYPTYLEQDLTDGWLDNRIDETYAKFENEEGETDYKAIINHFTLKEALL